MIQLETIFAAEQDPNVVFTVLMSALCEALKCVFAARISEGTAVFYISVILKRTKEPLLIVTAVVQNLLILPGQPSLKQKL